MLVFRSRFQNNRISEIFNKLITHHDDIRRFKCLKKSSVVKFDRSVKCGFVGYKRGLKSGRYDLTINILSYSIRRIENEKNRQKLNCNPTGDFLILLCRPKLFLFVLSLISYSKMPPRCSRIYSLHFQLERSRMFFARLIMF